MQANIDQANKLLAEEELEAEFINLSQRELAKYTDKDLALFQSKHPAGSPQFLIANHEWQRRLIVAQAKTSRLVALVGVMGTLLVAIVVHMLTKW